MAQGEAEISGQVVVLSFVAEQGQQSPVHLKPSVGQLG